MAFIGPAWLLLVLLTLEKALGDRAAATDAPLPLSAPAALAVSVSVTPQAVRLHIQASGDVEPGSVEVRFADGNAVVLARDAEGRPVRSQSLRLPAPVSVEGSSAEYDSDGALVLTLKKRASTAGLGADPEAAPR